MSRAALANSGADLTLRVFARGDLAHATEGPTRGYAHVGFADHPPEAPGHLDFAPLQLFAQGRMHPGEGLDTHRHENIDTIMIVRRGCLRHRDTSAGESLLRSGEVGVLAAGESAEHAEHAHGDTSLEALILWLRPDTVGGPSAFHRGTPDRAARHGRLAVIAAGGCFASPEALPVRSHSRVLWGDLLPGQTLTHQVQAPARGYLCVLGGDVEVNGVRVEAGGRVQAQGAGEICLRGDVSAEVVLVEMR